MPPVHPVVQESMTEPPALSPAEQARRARFIRLWGVWRFGLPVAVAWSLLQLWSRHRTDFRWGMLWSAEYGLSLGVATVVMGWFGGRWWGGRMYDQMRARGLTPRDEGE